MSKFKRHDVVVHRGGGVYMVVLGPDDGVRLEATGEKAYVYQSFWRITDDTLWVRAAAEMEDGRFKLRQHSTQGALGRLPEC